MEANESLMVGDWVKFKGSDLYHQVKVVSNKSIKFDNQRWFAKSSVEPILLTSEILEKNGWKHNDEDEKFFPQTWVGGGLMLQEADDGGYCIVVTSDYDDEDTNNTPFIILYVHELQHALRLRKIKKEIVL